MRKWNKEEKATFDKAWSKMVAKAWSDPAFKQRLIDRPREVFKENGIEVPSDIDCKIIENSDNVIYFHLPLTPKGSLGEDFLKDVSAGHCGCACGCKEACL